VISIDIHDLRLNVRLLIVDALTGIQSNKAWRIGKKVIQKLYELSEVAETIGLTLGTVRQYVSSGVIPALYLGRKRVVRADVLERICEEGLQTKRDEKTEQE
jgi:excisionase family DNA binding protein